MAPHILSRFARDSRGSVTIEALFWFLGILVIAALILDVTSVYQGQSTVLRAMQDGNRQLSIGRFTGTDVTVAEMEDATEAYIEAQLALLAPGAQARVEIDSVSRIATTWVAVPVSEISAVGFFGALDRATVTVSSKHLIEDWGTL